MARMKVVQVSKPGGNFELVEREIPNPARSQVRVKVEACGICHSDALVKEGLWPGLQYPRIPGHEIAGRINAVGEDVTQWKIGQRVGVGWHGGHCFDCDPCRRGDFVHCKNERVTAITHDGGYAEYMISAAEAVAAMPDDLGAADAAPLLCAGITVFNALRNQVRVPVNSSRFRESAVWVTSESNMRDRWDFVPSRLAAAPTRNNWRRNLARTNISTLARAILPELCKSLEARM